jgi:hypothetical protein
LPELLKNFTPYSITPIFLRSNKLENVNQDIAGRGLGFSNPGSRKKAVTNRLLI